MFLGWVTQVFGFQHLEIADYAAAGCGRDDDVVQKSTLRCWEGIGERGDIWKRTVFSIVL